MGLVKAVEMFEPERGLKFETFATHKIRGAILDELRAGDWATRSARTRVRRVDDAAQRLSQRLGRAPLDDEVAVEVGLDVDDVHAAHDDRARAAVLQLDALFDDHGGDPPIRSEILDPEAELLCGERTRELDDAIDRLSDRHGAVIRGYYLEERKLLDLAVDFGVTESRVCQIRAEGIRALREALVGASG
jgi:RNA polymerase sigma factor for flagellar operon FliA